MSDQATDQQLAPEQAAAELEHAQLVDVRTRAEYEAGHAASARHIPLEELQGRADELDGERPVVFYCRSGDRSTLAVDAFRASGWDAYAIAGGLLAWSERGLPLEPEGGEVAHQSGLPPA